MGDHAQTAQTIREIRGVAGVEYDGLDVLITKATRGPGSEFELLVPGGEAIQVAMRIGDGFLVTDSSTFSDLYTLLRADDDWITFRQETRRIRRPDMPGMRTTTSLIQVAPYAPKPLSEPDAAQ